jgi:peptidoglycan/xylan/chitin deacetylase (PgdA/CDA1 family)
MSLSSTTPVWSARGSADARLGPVSSRLAPTPSPLARARSRVLRELAAYAFPGSVLFARGARRGGKRLALTFDDGPDASTPRYLDVLEKLGVRATFFFIGENAAAAPDLVRDATRRGHELGSHGWSHEPFTAMEGSRLVEELARTDAALRPRRRRLVRPPRGLLSTGALLRIATSGRATILWSVDSDDCRTRDPREVARRLAPSRLLPGDVVLLHEGQPWTLEALPAVVGSLLADGWELVTVGELMGGEE